MNIHCGVSVLSIHPNCLFEYSPEHVTRLAIGFPQLYTVVFCVCLLEYSDGRRKKSLPSQQAAFQALVNIAPHAIYIRIINYTPNR